MAAVNTMRIRPSIFRPSQANIAAIVGILLAVSISGISQGDTNIPRITPETLARYLQQDLFISPGVGFSRVQIGHTFGRVVKTWGAPNKASGHEINKNLSTSVGSGTIEWVYLVGRDSEITVSGVSRVKMISVESSFSSPFSSTEGASFGMTPQQIISIYGPPADKDNLTQLLYSTKGIAFGFEHGSLKTIRVFKPELGPTSTSDQTVK